GFSESPSDPGKEADKNADHSGAGRQVPGDPGKEAGSDTDHQGASSQGSASSCNEAHRSRQQALNQTTSMAPILSTQVKGSVALSMHGRALSRLRLSGLVVVAALLTSTFCPRSIQAKVDSIEAEVAEETEASTARTERLPTRLEG